MQVGCFKDGLVSAITAAGRTGVKRKGTVWSDVAFAIM